MTPQAARGDEAAADAQVQIAVRALEGAFNKYGSQSAKGRGLLKVLGILAKDHGRGEDRARGILPAELKQIATQDTAPPSAAPPPAGAAPPGLPPGGGGAAGAMPGG